MDDKTIQDKRARRAIRWGKLSCLFAALSCALIMIGGYFITWDGDQEPICPPPLPLPAAILQLMSLLFAAAVLVVSPTGLVLGIIDIIKGPERVPPLIGILLSVLPFVAVFLFLLILCC